MHPRETGKSPFDRLRGACGAGSPRCLSHGAGSVKQIVAHQLGEQLVPVQTADHRSGVVVVGDVGGILREKIAYDLIDGIVTLFGE